MTFNKKNMTIALLIDETENAYQSVLCKGISEYAGINKVNLMIFPGRAFNSPFSFEYQFNVIYNLIQQNQFAGIIIAADTICPYMENYEIDEFFRSFKEVSVLSIARKILKFPCIRIDNRNGIKKIMTHLVNEHGCRRIAFLKGLDQNYDSKERFKGYQESIQDLGLNYNSELIIEGNNSFESARIAFRKLYKKQWGNFEALVINNDEMALGVMDVLNSKNKKIPHDLLITGFDNVAYSKYNNPPLTTIEQPIMELGERSLELLLQKIKGKKIPAETIIKSKLIVRQSCGCLPLAIVQYEKIDKKEIKFIRSRQSTDFKKYKEELLKKLSINKLNNDYNYILIDILLKLTRKKKISSKEINCFLKDFSSLLRQDSLKGNNIENWQNILVILRPYFLKMINNEKNYNLMEEIFQKARIVLGDMILLDFASKRIKNNNKLVQLLNITRRLITVFNNKELVELIASELSKIGISYYYIFQYQRIKKNYKNIEWEFPEYSKMILDSNCKNLHDSVCNEFKTIEIMDMLLKNENGFQMIIIPIFFKYEQLGTMALQYLPGEIGIYKSICGQLSSALKGAILYNDQREVEGKLANILQNLKVSVEERTSALKTGIAKRKTSEEKARQRNIKLIKINEELQSAMEELEATNEEFEAQNEKLLGTQNKLEKSEERFRSLAEATNDWIWELDKNCIYSYVSPCVKEILGYHPDEIVGKSPYDFLASYEIPRIKAIFENLIKQGKKIENIEWIILNYNSEPVWFETNGISIFNEKNNFNGFRGVSRNITERKKAAEALTASRQRLAIHVEKTPLGLIEWDADFNIVAWNDAAENIFGYSSRDALGKNMLKLIFPPDLIAKAKIKWKQLLERRKNESSLHENIALDKRSVICEWYSTVLIDHNSRLIGGASLVLNVTERKRAQELMVQNEKMMTVGGLAAGMAHEINNPLSIIVQGVQSILRRISLKNSDNVKMAKVPGIDLNLVEEYFNKRGVVEYLKGVEEAGFRAANIVADMMQFSSKNLIDKKGVSINRLIDETIDIASRDYNFEKKYNFSGIKIIKHYSNKLPCLNCIETEIKQVILNLLKNSTQAIFNFNKKGYAPQIEIFTYKKKNFLVIEVCDNGSGMDEYIKQHLFEPFFTTKAFDQGTGLGLSVSYYIVTNNHNGKMRVVSEVKQGTTFFVELPFEFPLL